MTTSEVSATAHRARHASYELALAGRAIKDAALHAMADALDKQSDEILSANARDVARQEEAGAAAPLIDRLRLTTERVGEMAAGMKSLAALPDPVGEVVRGQIAPSGVELRQVRVPFGVVGIIYEGRPNVTADAAGICLKSGNAVLLRGSSSALESNTTIVAALRSALDDVDLPIDSIQLVLGEREAVAELMQARGLVDVLIPVVAPR